MRHLVLIRSAYGPGWSIEANRRRLALTEGVTIASLLSQSVPFGLIVLVHVDDPLRPERMAAFAQLPTTFIWTGESGKPAEVAYGAYRAAWADAIGPRDAMVAMTRLDDDDAFAPWAMERVQIAARQVRQRTALMLPVGVRVWDGRYTLVRHASNAMHTLVTPPGDHSTVYDYGHRKVRQFAQVKVVDNRPAWLWSRHADTISGWRIADRPLCPEIRAMFRIDWSLFGQAERAQKVPLVSSGRCFR